MSDQKLSDYSLAGCAFEGFHQITLLPPFRCGEFHVVEFSSPCSEQTHFHVSVDTFSLFGLNVVVGLADRTTTNSLLRLFHQSDAMLVNISDHTSALHRYFNFFWFLVLSAAQAQHLRSILSSQFIF